MQKFISFISYSKVHPIHSTMFGYAHTASYFNLIAFFILQPILSVEIRSAFR